MKLPFYGIVTAIFSLIGVSIGCSKKPDAHFGTHPASEQYDENKIDAAFGSNPGDSLDDQGEND